MPDSPAPIPRTPLDRTAMERVLARAAELQARSGDAADAMSDDQILDLGKEVGLSPQHLRQALAEERSGNGRAVGGALFGPGTVVAERTIRATAAEVFTALGTWMEKDELLQIKRQFPDRIVWEPRRDFEGNVRRMFNIGGRGYALTKATDVGATVVPVDEGRVLVRLDANLSAYRRNALVGVAASTTVGAAAGVIAVALHFALIVAPIPVLALGGAGYLVARGVHSSALSRVQLTLEQLLDRLERGERADNPSLLKLIAQAAGAVQRRY